MSDGTIFAYPTESFYALGAPATDKKAIQHLFRMKHRDPDKPIALIAADTKQVKKYFHLSKFEAQLAKAYWPGALTILLTPKKSIAADALFGTTPSRRSSRHPSSGRRGAYRIGVRVPAHVGARRLASKLGAPITATSANISGRPPTKARTRVKRDFPDILVVPGKCGRATQPSTIVEIRKNTLAILRDGAVKIQ